MRRLRVRHSSAQDIEQIFDYIAEAAGDETARRFTADIEASIPQNLPRYRAPLGGRVPNSARTSVLFRIAVTSSFFVMSMTCSRS